jgi:hypothetical protein
MEARSGLSFSMPETLNMKVKSQRFGDDLASSLVNQISHLSRLLRVVSLP